MQETPFGRRGNSNYVLFENDVHVQTSLNKLGTKCAIFFEFRHYKVDKKKVGGSASSRGEALAPDSDRFKRDLSRTFSVSRGNNISILCTCPSHRVQKSCKCYSFMEMDEVKAGPVTLEVSEVYVAEQCFFPGGERDGFGEMPTAQSG